MRAAYAAGGVCVGARQAGALIGYVWFAFEAAPHVAGIWVALAGAIYRYKALVLRQHRGKGIAPALYRFADHLFEGMGREAVVNCIATHNFASTAASLRSGAGESWIYRVLAKGARFFSYHSPAVRTRLALLRANLAVVGNRLPKRRTDTAKIQAARSGA